MVLRWLRQTPDARMGGVEVNRIASLLVIALVLGGCADGADSASDEVPAFDVPAPAGGFGPSTSPTPTPQANDAAPAPVPGSTATPEPPATTPIDTGGAGAGAPPPTVPETTEPPATPPPPQQPTSSADPIIPAVTADCPDFRSGTITFMGLGGIRMEAGAKAPGPTAPMVFYWHGTGSFSGEFAGMAGAVHAGVVAEGGVLISFQGSTGGDALSGTAVFGRGDLDLVDQLVACAVRDHNVDPKRIYTTGCSAGGLFATNMAALRSNYVAAAAPNSGGMSFPQQFQRPDQPPALMTMHGAAGRDVVIIDFSQSSATADMIFKNAGAFVINCDHGGGHCGAGGIAPSVWEFFKAHPYGVDPEPYAGGLPAGFNSACQIY